MYVLYMKDMVKNVQYIYKMLDWQPDSYLDR